jgi:hypothetical protein
MSEIISIGNAEDKKVKHKMEENLEPGFEKVPIATPPSSQSDVEDIVTPKLNICTKSTSKPLEIGEHSSSSQNATGESSSQNIIGGSLSSGYDGLYMPNTTPTSPRFVMQMPNSSLATSQFGMTNFTKVKHSRFGTFSSSKSNPFNCGECKCECSSWFSNSSIVTL